jgi:LPXTG-motif cell wall-anchored protein
MFVARSPKMGAATFAGIGMIFVGIFAILLGIFGISVAGATQPNPEHKITLCHRTDSYSNPYVTESVDVASELFEGHDGHNGPVFFAAIPKGTKWGDIIPAFDFGPGEQYGGKNVPEGQAILDNDCVAPDAVTTTTTPVSLATTTTTEPESITTSTTVGGRTITASTEPVGGLGNPNPSTPGVEPGGSGILPVTGSSAVVLFGAGAALVAGGIGLVIRRRRWA